MDTAHFRANRRRVPEVCRYSPNASHDGTFGIYLCNVRQGQCYYRGPIFILDSSGRRFECRKVEAPELDETPT